MCGGCAGVGCSLSEAETPWAFKFAIVYDTHTNRSVQHFIYNIKELFFCILFETVPFIPFVCAGGFHAAAFAFPARAEPSINIFIGKRTGCHAKWPVTIFLINRQHKHVERHRHADKFNVERFSTYRTKLRYPANGLYCKRNRIAAARPMLPASFLILEREKIVECPAVSYSGPTTESAV